MSLHHVFNLSIGDKVTYVPRYGERKKGIIKSISPDNSAAFVVYNCDNDWDNYQNYTAARTELSDLKKGWV